MRSCLNTNQVFSLVLRKPSLVLGNKALLQLLWEASLRALVGWTDPDFGSSGLYPVDCDVRRPRVSLLGFQTPSLLNECPACGMVWGQLLHVGTTH